MHTPKEYQIKTLDALRLYFRECQRIGKASTAFHEVTEQIHGTVIPYSNVDELPGLPYICLRIPTGGGKTFVACHSISIAANELLHADSPLVLWLVPSNAIKDQTLSALKERNHPYRRALEESASSVNVLEIQEALYVTCPTLSSGTTIIVSTMQAFRVDVTEGRKVYDQSGALMEHFDGLDPTLVETLEKYENGKPIPSLANLLRKHRPIVIVDEAHNARTSLSFETLARFNPSCIIEFTATPAIEGDDPSNVLYSVSAAELKADSMIKLPIRLETRPDWKELIGDAIIYRKHLEDLAKAEQRATGEYIRPIMLLQAQAKNKQRATLTVEEVEKCLVEDFSIPPEEIRRATGEDKGLEGIDLAGSSCVVRYIITVQALREGWDCPFAYVLCTVAEMSSSTAVEQILGRIMRLPKANRKQNEELNMAFAFAASQNFIEAANALESALVQNGFTRQEAKDLIARSPSNKQGSLEQFWLTASEPLPEVPNMALLPPELAKKISFDTEKHEIRASEPLTEEDSLNLKNTVKTPEAKAAIERLRRKSVGLAAEPPKSPSERGEVFTIPCLSIKQGDLFETFEETHVLEVPWELSKCPPALSEEDYSPKRFDGKVIEIDVTDKGKLAQRFLPDLVEQMTMFAADQVHTVVTLAGWLDRTISHPDIAPSETSPFLLGLVNHLVEKRGIELARLFKDKYVLRNAVAKKIDAFRLEAKDKAFQTLLLPECSTPIVVTPEHCFSFHPEEYPYNTLYRGAYQFKKHYYKQIGNLKEAGEEFDCAKFIDTLPEVKFWVRNIERSERFSFWFQTSSDKFYPDFVCMLQDDRYLVVEYKGEDRWSNDDSKEKRGIGELWAARSKGTCLFVMPKGKDLDAIATKVRK